MDRAKTNHPLLNIEQRHTPCSPVEVNTHDQVRVRLRSPRVPFHLLLVAEAKEARTDAYRQPGADSVEEPLEGEEAGHRDDENKLVERVHGHPTLLQERVKGNG